MFKDINHKIVIGLEAQAEQFLYIIDGTIFVDESVKTNYNLPLCVRSQLRLQ
jgi:hypothetical protein